MRMMLTDHEIDSGELKEIPAERSSVKRPVLRAAIPLSWLSCAACIRGRRVLHTALALWHLSTLTRNKTVKMQGRILEAFGVPRRDYNPALVRLETAGLIFVARKAGCTPRVTILKAASEEGSASHERSS